MRSSCFISRQLLSIIIGVLCASISICSVSCGLFEPQPVDIRAGLYEGEFSVVRNTPSGMMLGTWRTQVRFSNGLNFQVLPTSADSIPLSGNGTYTLRYRLITLTDRVSRSRTPSPDSLISGEYVYTFDGTNLVMTQEQDGVRRQLFLNRR